MCLPALALAGIALAAGGVGMKYFGEKKADHALTHTFNREHDRQKAFEQDQIAAFQDSLNGAKTLADPAAMAAAAARREAVLNSVTKSAAPAAAGYLPGSSSAPAIVNDHATAAGAKADAGTHSLAAAIASMGGMGDQFLNNDINTAHNSQTIGQIGGFRGGSLDVLQSEMEAAKQKGKTLRTLGSLAQTIGQSMLTGGIGGAGGLGPMAVNMGGSAPLPFMSGGLTPELLSSLAI